MPTDPLVTQVLNRTPVAVKISVSKTFDLSEELNTVLARQGITAPELAERLHMSPHELAIFLFGLDGFYDQVARLEAALQADLFVSASGLRYFPAVVTEG
jgi:transcriptional regulator with XRE-family HTH domain